MSYPPPSPWFEARITGTVDLGDVTGLDYPVNGHLVQQATRTAMTDLLRGLADTDELTDLDLYLYVRSARGSGSVRITGIPFGTGGLTIPPPGVTEAQALFYVADNRALWFAVSDRSVPLDNSLSSVMAALAARQLLGTGPHTLELGDYGTITWDPTGVLVSPDAGVPNHNTGPWVRTDYSGPVGNWRALASQDPAYGVWLWFTDPATGEPDGDGWKVSFLVNDWTDSPDDRVDDPDELAPTRPQLLVVTRPEQAAL